MAVVTDKQFYIDDNLIAKLDLMVGRLDKKLDNLVLIDGDEGHGKSNMECGIAKYISWKTGRPFNVSNVFFDLNEMMDFAIKTKEQIICWDEGALGGLASEWWRKNQIEFVKLLMIARKKRHFFIICIPKFFKLNEYLVVDRSIALIHVYARNETDLGRFVYYNKKAKENLFYNWRKTKMRNYKKNLTFRGSFLEYLPKVIDEEAYEKKKDFAILHFRQGDDRLTPARKEKLKREFQTEVITRFLEYFPEFTKRNIAKGLGIKPDAISQRLKGLKQAPVAV